MNQSIKPNLTFHHVGLVVDNLNDAITNYSTLFGSENVSEAIFVSSQSVNVCFVKNGVESYLELIEPTDENSVVYPLLKKRISYYHVAYLISEFEKTILKLEELNYKVLSSFHSEAFEGKRCAFAYTPDAHLIELIER